MGDRTDVKFRRRIKNLIKKKGEKRMRDMGRKEEGIKYKCGKKKVIEERIKKIGKQRTNI
jgi:hypothetical protein